VKSGGGSTPARTIDAISHAREGGWPTQAALWLEWGCSHAGQTSHVPSLVQQPTHARADFTSVREKSCPLNKSGSPLDFASA
jgi:hypothetical protein